MFDCAVIIRPGDSSDPVFVPVSEDVFRSFLKEAHEFTALRICFPKYDECTSFFVESVATGFNIGVFDLEEDEDIPEYITSWMD